VLVAKLARDLTLLSEMASYPSSPLRIEFRNVERLQVVARQASVDRATTDLPPFAALAARLGRPLRVGILSDFIRIPYANGAAFQTRFLYQELRRCGHEVTIIGPNDPDADPKDLAPGTVTLPSVPLKTYPGVHIPLPLAPWVYDPDRFCFDIVFGQTTSLLLELGNWMRKMKGIPFLCVNTTHLVAAYDVLLPERLSKIDLVKSGVFFALKPFEQTFVRMYNESDGLIVLSEGLQTYWRERGVTVPIHVIPRAVQPDNFDKPLGPDPYAHAGPASAGGGPRLLCAGRHTREKSQDRVIRIFARHVAPLDPTVTLTVIGQGPDTEMYRRVARELGVGERVLFPGEVPFARMPDYYAYADVFVHASLSETYGNVLSEALWCGTPVVAFADGMGVSSQLEDGVNGLVLAPGRGEDGASEADLAFGRAIVRLLAEPRVRGRLGAAAAKMARAKAHPRVVNQKLAGAFLAAQDHLVASGLRPVVDQSQVLRWYTTFRHFRPWTTVMGGLFLFGHLRPGKSQTLAPIHPQIAR
jgi:1,2-diacylglycerol 3-alpha-glucosyltransferase